jgi:hypothetical protein
LAIGYIKKKVVEGVETLVPETTAGPSAGTVRKLSFDCNVDYAVTITADETGEGYVGVSGNCKLSFNPKYNIGTVADPEYIGVLKADCFCGKGTNTEIADCVEIGEVCQNLNYKVPFTCNCELLTACSQNLLYNPNTGLLCSNCMCIANNLEVLCDICSDEYKSRTTGVGITVDTTAEDDTLNHSGDVIYKGCNGELATSNCNDFKYNPSTGTLTVDHVCSCDVQDEIKADKLDNNVCYCSSAKANDNAAVVMHAYRCTIDSNNPRESYATLDYDGFYLTCVPFCQQEGSSSNYTRAQIGDHCNNFVSENGNGGCVYSNMASTSLAINEGVVCCSNGCLCCGGYTQLGLSNYERTIKKCGSGLDFSCVSIVSDCRNYTAVASCRSGTCNYLGRLSITPTDVTLTTSCGSFTLNRDGSIDSCRGLIVSCPAGGSYATSLTNAALSICNAPAANNVWTPILAQSSTGGTWTLGIDCACASDWLVRNVTSGSAFIFKCNGSFYSSGIYSDCWCSQDSNVGIYQNPDNCDEICVHANYVCFDSYLEFCSACADELCAGSYVETEDLCVCNTLYTKYICFYS